MVHALPMHNGKYHVILLAGGPRDLAREIRDKLAKSRNILVKHHWEYDKAKQWDAPIPRDVDFVIVLKDLISHWNFFKVKEACKSSGLRWIVTQRKMATMLDTLSKYGVRKSAPLPLHVTSTTYFKDAELEVVKPAPTPEVEVEPEPLISTPIHVPLAEVTLPAPARRGTPSPEAMILIAALQQRVQDDGISIMITPNSITIEPAK